MYISKYSNPHCTPLTQQSPQLLLGNRQSLYSKVLSLSICKHLQQDVTCTTPCHHLQSKPTTGYCQLNVILSLLEQSMKILILGGTVFLGRHLVDAARARGHTVTL